MNYPNYLSIRESSKGIPYGGSGVRREDGEANYGFKNLKSSPNDVSLVPELASDWGLSKVVATINAPHTGLFSVGCLVGAVTEELGHRYTGYVEFSLNSKSLVQDAQNYFPLFYHFNRVLHRERFTLVKFDWELMGATFIDAGIHGFTCAVFVNTQHFSTPEAARAAWHRALELLAAYFDAVPDDTHDPIYPPYRAV